MSGTIREAWNDLLETRRKRIRELERRAERHWGDELELNQRITELQAMIVELELNLQARNDLAVRLMKGANAQGVIVAQNGYVGFLTWQKIKAELASVVRAVNEKDPGTLSGPDRFAGVVAERLAVILKIEEGIESPPLSWGEPDAGDAAT